MANAVFDGRDALMLSAETASGRYPLESVRDDGSHHSRGRGQHRQISQPTPHKLNVAETTAELICHASEELEMKVIAVFTQTGSSARLISKHRPRVPIIAFSPGAGDAPADGALLGSYAAHDRRRAQRGRAWLRVPKGGCSRRDSCAAATWIVGIVAAGRRSAWWRHDEPA